MKLSDLNNAKKLNLAIEHAWFFHLLPALAPRDWQEVAVPQPAGSKKEIPTKGYTHDSGAYTVIITGETESDGLRWLTFTLVRADRAPSLQEVEAVKHIFLGQEMVGVLRLARVSDKQHPLAAHFFFCADKPDLLPDFKRK